MLIDRIRNLREDNDISQTEIANALNISQRAYSHYESGTRNIPIDILIKIADFYDCSIDYLLRRSDKKNIYR